jgi:hypothetical protein
MYKGLRQQLESVGWKLARADQPGIYVKAENILANDEIDWTSEPDSMLLDLKKVRASRERQIRRKREKRTRAVDSGF